METEVLLGVSITKKLIPSIANVIGTDMSVYKIIEKRQFAYGTVTSRNGEKISIALSDQYNKALVSQIYVVFEVIDIEELLPEYLMMWFSRPEFDRYVRFHSHGSTRETFDWADMCEVELPIPAIEEQRQIVAQYQSIANKIKVNEQICEKLEATAQALYKHWFVDFEFPNEAGKPYKSSEGKMVWSEELGKEIPEGWEVNNLNKITNKIYSGGTPSTENDNFWNGIYYWFSSGETGNRFIIQTDKSITEDGIKGSTTKLCKKYCTVIATAGQGKTRGQSALLFTDVYINQSVICVEPKKDIYSLFIFIDINSRYNELRNNSDAQSIRGSINSDDIKNLRILMPTDLCFELFYSKIKNSFDIVENKKYQNQKLTQLQSLLLSRLAVGEEVGA
ncbi:restriction endonuclease subunit S [Kaistella sp. DKR-2]|uniref:restriction endonuclease subunit S n=1 Tax=Kaistella soli TaxID=2849654 RepID=UPI001C2527DB|nr:restriction endonuclease subunit S [Kaistella soli]MBU8881538.1 restriction endonuclease subunit S [Kaistella soli]